jgi:hypothetical protein
MAKTHGGRRTGAGRPPRKPGQEWISGPPVTRGPVTGRVVQALARTREEADSWRAAAKAAGVKLEDWLADRIREALSNST